MTHKIFPHGDFFEVAPGLWQLRGSLPYPLPRYMTVWRLPDSSLLIYSAVALDEAGMQKLEALGKPTVMVVPHSLHLMDAVFYKLRYPHLKVIAPEAAKKRLDPACPVDESPAEGLKRLGLRGEVVPGSKCDEVMLDLDLANGERVLVFTDLLAYGAPKNLMMRIMGPPGGKGIARIVRLRQIGDKAGTRAFLERMAKEPKITKILLAHAKPWEGPSAELLLAAAAQL